MEEYSLILSIFTVLILWKKTHVDIGAEKKTEKQDSELGLLLSLSASTEKCVGYIMARKKHNVIQHACIKVALEWVYERKLGFQQDTYDIYIYNGRAGYYLLVASHLRQCINTSAYWPNNHYLFFFICCCFSYESQKNVIKSCRNNSTLNNNIPAGFYCFLFSCLRLAKYLLLLVAFVIFYVFTWQLLLYNMA